MPTIGPKTAARLVFHLLNGSRADAAALAEAIVHLKDRVQLCSRCHSITEVDPCDVCTDPQRNGALICVVAEAKDVFAIERTSAYDGRYHVLGGLISPMDGIGPSQLRVRELVDRVAAESPAEILVATNPNAEGEATALYLSRLLAPSGVNVTRLAYGLPRLCRRKHAGARDPGPPLAVSPHRQPVASTSPTAISPGTSTSQ